jgi:TrmH family RNA methyltransferase
MPAPAPITSKSNARVKALRASFSGKPSQPGELLGLEGEHLIAEAVRSGLTLETLFLREGSEGVLARPSLAAVDARDTLILSRDVFASAVETASPQGIAATVLIPEQQPLEMRANPGMFLFLENIQDPGNLGTLIRSAEAFGIRAIHVTPGTANTWNPKTVRASAGSVFRIQLFSTSLHEFADNMSWSGIKTFAAVAREEGAGSLHQADLSAPCAIMIGNEGAGLSSDAVSLANQRVHIPCAVESLNAAIAGAVIMYEAARQNGERFLRGAV